MSQWRDNQIISFEIAKERRELRQQRSQWDGNCHGCQLPIKQETIASIGPFRICNSCIKEHFPNPQYSVNQAADILETIRFFK